MTVSYKKLWKLLIDKNMKKKDLRAVISTDILAKICRALECDVGDIMEMVNDKSDS